MDAARLPSPPGDWIRWRGVDRNADRRQRSCGRTGRFPVRYFNADGSEMCGNGAMCGADSRSTREIAPNPCTFETQSGIVRANCAIPRVCKIVWLDIPTLKPSRSMHIDLDGECLSLHAVTVGVPHVVLVVDDADSWPSHREFHETGAAIRRHPQFAPAGTNGMSFPCATMARFAWRPMNAASSLKH